MALWSDKELLGYLKDFGQVVTVGDAEEHREVLAILDVQSVDVFEVEGVERVLRCRASDMTGVVRGVGVTVAEGESYSVLRVRSRNDGLVDVHLVAHGSSSYPSNGDAPEPPPAPPRPGDDNPDPDLPPGGGG